MDTDMHCHRHNALLLVLTSIMIFAGCRDGGIVEPGEVPFPQKIVDITDSSFAIAATKSAPSGPVTLSVRGTIRFKALTSPLRISGYRLRYFSQTTHVNIDYNLLKQDYSDSLFVNDNIQNYFPLTLNPLQSIDIDFLTTHGGIDTVVTVKVVVQSTCTFQGAFEPGLKNLFEGLDLGANRILWSHDSQTLYFTVPRQINEQVCRYNLREAAIRELTPRDRALTLHDESTDGKKLLLSDNNAKPSNLYTLDLKTLSLEILRPPSDSTIVTSAKFSPDNSRIAFTTMSVGPVIDHSDLWLFNQNDFSLKKLSPNIVGHYLTLTDWNSSNEFVCHSNWMDIYMISSADLAVRRLVYSLPFYPREILSDHSTVAGLLMVQDKLAAINETHLLLYDLAGKPVRQLTFSSEVAFVYSVSPDRKWLAYTAYRGVHKNVQLFLLPIDGL